MANEKTNLIPEARLLWAYKWWLAGALALGLLVGFVVTLPALWTPEYRARASFAVPSFDDVIGFGYREDITGIDGALDEDLERFAGLLTADSTKLYMAQRFNLKTHYELQGEGPSAYKRLMSRYDDHVEVSLSRYSTIEVSVYDKDPALAQALAQAHIAYADSFLEMTAGRHASLAALGRSLDSLKAYRTALHDSLGALRALYGIRYGALPGDRPTSQNATARTDRRLGYLYYDRLLSVIQELEYLNELVAQLVSRRARLQENLAAYPSLLQVTAYPARPRYPARPKRLFVTLGVALSMLVMAVLLVLVLEGRVLPRGED